MNEGWAALTLLQKVVVVALGWFGLALVALSLWWLLVGQHRDDDDELREAVRRKVRDDERGGNS